MLTMRATIQEAVKSSIREHMRQIARLGALATNSKLTPKQRSAKARKAANARWAKVGK